jgi:hypothetical protein
MSPLVLIVCAPVIVVVVAFVSLLLGAATAGAWEVIERQPQSSPTTAPPGSPQVTRHEGPHARAA